MTRAAPGLGEPEREEGQAAARDLRAPLLGGAAWVGGLFAAALPSSWPRVIGALVVVAAAALAVRRGLARARGQARPPLDTRLIATAIAACLLLVAVAFSGGVRGHQVGRGAVAELAADEASVEVLVQVTSDPRRAQSRPEGVVVRAHVLEVTGRGRTWRVRAPVVLLADEAWLRIPLGATVATSGRLSPAEGEVAGLLRAGDPVPVAPPDRWWRAAAVVRAGIREAVAPRSEDQRALVPSLVVGDDSGLDQGLAEDFRVTGLTHLLAVSGTNLTLLVGFLVLAARWCGVRAWGRYVVGAAGIAAFVLLARTEPSVVRAAAMGCVALTAFTSNGRDRGLRALGVAVVLLLLWQPGLAVQAGFALSVLATAGILLLAPEWRDCLARWMPRWLAEALTVPAAAQLACTPVVAAISGQVSLVAVLANLLVAPAVAPATVLGLLGGLCVVVWPPLGHVVALPAAWAVGWIIAVARWGAGLPLPAIGWGTGGWALAALTAVVVLIALLAPRLLVRPGWTLAVGALMLVAVLVRPPNAGWPPRDWVLVACDVGQGDALVLRAGPGSAVVVDAGPDPGAVDRCLDRLDVRAVPLLVLTHFHADHVDGLAGVLSGRVVGEVNVSPLAAPESSAAASGREFAQAGLRPVVAPHLQMRRVGDVTLRQVWPPPDWVTPGSTEDAAVNDASVVLLAQVRGIDILLMGDLEPTGQSQLATLLGDLRVDVLKVAHHGSRYQDERLLASLAPRLAVLSVGAENTYGHPSPYLLGDLRALGAVVLRTDLDGDVAVLGGQGRLSTATQR